MRNEQSTAARRLSIVTLAITLFSAPALAGSFVIVNTDGAGEGFNDMTPATPVIGNGGTTLGAQRLNAFQAAANYWGSFVGQAQEIRVSASMDPLFCDSMGAVLGSAGASISLADFPNAPQAGTWYPVGLANNLANSDQCTPAQPCGGFSDDIEAQFNSNVNGSPGCLGGTTWWYGVGGTAPPGTVDLYTTVLHEIGHGLGFATLVDLLDDQQGVFGSEPFGMPDVFESRLQDLGMGQFWPDLTDGQRAASAIGGQLFWSGSCVAAQCGRLDTSTDLDGNVAMYAPGTLVPGSSVSHWDDALSPNELMEPALNSGFLEDRLTLALMKDLGWKVSELGMRAVGDANDDGDQDFAVLTPDFSSGSNVVHVIDGGSGQTIQSLFFVASLSTLDLEVVPDFGGTTANEVAVLLNDPITRQSRVMLKDAASGATLNTIYYATTLTPIDMEILPDFAGGPAPEIAVLLRETTGAKRVRVLIKDAGTGAVLRDQFFVKTFMPMDLEVLPSFAGTGVEELAVLGRNCDDQRVQVLVKDADSGVLLNTVFFAKNFVPLDLEIVPNYGGTAAAELALMARSSANGAITVRIKDAMSDAQLSRLNFSKFFTPLKIEVVPHFGGGTAPEIAMVLRQNSDGGVRVLIKDGGTGSTLRTMIFAADRFPRDLAVLPDISGNGISEIGVLSVKESNNQRTAIVRDASTNALVRFSVIP